MTAMMMGNAAIEKGAEGEGRKELRIEFPIEAVYYTRS